MDMDHAAGAGLVLPGCGKMGSAKLEGWRKDETTGLLPLMRKTVAAAAGRSRELPYV